MKEEVPACQCSKSWRRAAGREGQVALVPVQPPCQLTWWSLVCILLSPFLHHSSSLPSRSPASEQISGSMLNIYPIGSAAWSRNYQQCTSSGRLLLGVEGSGSVRANSYRVQASSTIFCRGDAHGLHLSDAKTPASRLRSDNLRLALRNFLVVKAGKSAAHKAALQGRIALQWTSVGISLNSAVSATCVKCGWSGEHARRSSREAGSSVAHHPCRHPGRTMRWEEATSRKVKSLDVISNPTAWHCGVIPRTLLPTFTSILCHELRIRFGRLKDCQINCSSFFFITRPQLLTFCVHYKACNTEFLYSV